MIANIASDDGLILPYNANPTGSNFWELQAGLESIGELFDLLSSYTARAAKVRFWHISSVRRSAPIRPAWEVTGHITSGLSPLSILLTVPVYLGSLLNSC
jgi:hypothetical protein